MKGPAGESPNKCKDRPHRAGELKWPPVQRRRRISLVIDGHRNRDAIYLVALGLALSVLVALLLSAFDYFTRGG